MANMVPRVQPDEEPTKAAALTLIPGKRLVPQRQGAGTRLGEILFRTLVYLCTISILVIVALIFYELVRHSQRSIATSGWHFFTSQDWDPVSGEFGALPFIYGTIVSSLVALVIAVPLALGLAVFLTEMCPRRLRTPLAFATELLAAIPSVIYGLWGIFVLAPLLRVYVEPWCAKYLGWTGLFEGPPFGIGMLAAGVILAIMVLPIISSISREVMMAVPRPQREAVLALGATRWETVRTGVLRNARTGIIGAVILGLGRALGETMAVTMVIGNTPQISRSLLAPANTLASVVANEFAEATDSLYLSALIEIALALFLITIVVNVIARLLVWSTTRGAPTGIHA